MALRLSVSAPSETSAQTGLLTSLRPWLLASLRGLFCLLAMCLWCSGDFTSPFDFVAPASCRLFVPVACLPHAGLPRCPKYQFTTVTRRGQKATLAAA